MRRQNVYVRCGTTIAPSESGQARLFICREVDETLIERCSVLKGLMSTVGEVGFTDISADDFCLLEKFDASDASNEELVRVLQVRHISDRNRTIFTEEMIVPAILEGPHPRSCGARRAALQLSCLYADRTRRGEITALAANSNRTRI
jgi:hypothetical protein